MLLFRISKDPYVINCTHLCQNYILRYSFRLLDTSGWNFRHAHFHEEGRRTLYKAYGIKFMVLVQGRAGEMVRQT